MSDSGTEAKQCRMVEPFMSFLSPDEKRKISLLRTPKGAVKFVLNDWTGPITDYAERCILTMDQFDQLWKSILKLPMYPKEVIE